MRVFVEPVDVVDELGHLSAEQVRGLAIAFLQVRTSLQMTMHDMRDWDADDPDPQQLARYIEHLTFADHGTCAVCAELVYAPDRYVELRQRGRLWHPRILARALRRLYLALRYGTWQLAHRRCARRWLSTDDWKEPEL